MGGSSSSLQRRIQMFEENGGIPIHPAPQVTKLGRPHLTATHAQHQRRANQPVRTQTPPQLSSSERSCSPPRPPAFPPPKAPDSGRRQYTSSGPSPSDVKILQQIVLQQQRHRHDGKPPLPPKLHSQVIRRKTPQIYGSQLPEQQVQCLIQIKESKITKMITQTTRSSRK